MQTSKIFKLTIVGLLAGLGALVQPSTARAEEPFPGGLQEAAGLSCAPSCTLCHTTNPGQVNTWTKPFGAAVINRGATKGSGEAGIKTAWAKLVVDAQTPPMNPNDPGDPNVIAARLVASLRAGLDPETGAELCQVTYGCGAHIAKDAPRDDWSGLLFVAGAMGFGALLRRAKRR
jgi:hypothetical protein